MNSILYSIFILLLQTSPSGLQDHRYSIEILDDEALQFLDENTKVVELANGFTWTEGPLYLADEKALLFSDIPENKIFKIDSNGRLSDYLHPSGYLGDDFTGAEPGSNGLLLDQTGNLVLMQHGERRIARMMAPIDDPKPEYQSLVSHFMGKRLNSPNDGVFDSQGNLYFTDPPYGLPERMDDPGKELSFQGVYFLRTNGDLLLIDTLSRPNGISLSPDGSRLYAAVSDPDHAVWYEYEVLTPGKVRNKRLFYDSTDLIGREGQQGLPDGMKIHSSGYLFASGPGGIWIFNPDAKPVARIYTGQATSNCAFSDDEKRLYITADDYVLAVELK